MHSGFKKGLCGIGISLFGFFFVDRLPAAQEFKQHVPPTVATATAVGRLPANKRLRLGVGLPLRNTVEFTNLLRDLYNPSHPNYRKFLTPQEFTSRFGPAQQDYQAVADFFKAHGFAIRTKHSNRVLLDVEGSVDVIEKTLHVTLRDYRHPSEARNFFAPDSEPWLDLNVPILHISGLDNFLLPHPASLHWKPTGGDRRPVPNGGSAPGGDYMGADFRAAYAPGVTLTGAGQYVALVQFDGYYASDITAYASQAGLTNVPLVNVLLDEVDGTPGKDNIEVALDIEMCMSMAPGLTGILVYEGLNGNDILNRIANDNLARQVSASWSFPTDATTETIFQQMMAQGQSYFNASGDNGAYVGTISTPSDSPSITSVGGTTLSTRGPGAAWVSETAWNWIRNGQSTAGTGGGISTVWPIPSWQQGIDMSANQGSTSMRNIPDVAMVADQVFVISDNGTTGSVGGTSVASPLWAAFTALVNQQATLAGQPPVGFLNPSIYALAKSTGYSAALHDVTTGNNTNASSPTRFYASAGYDLCTGWGTPTGRSLINALAPPVNAPSIIAGTPALVLETCSPTNGVIDPAEAVTVSLPLRNVGGVNTTSLAVTLLASNGVVPLSGAQSYGVLSGGGAAVAKQFAFSVNGACGGQFSPVLKLQDGTNDLGTITLNMQIGAPTLAFSETFEWVTAPALPAGWTVAQTGGGNAWVTSTALSATAGNSVFAFEPTTAGSCELVSPAVNISSPSAQLVFKNWYNTEVGPDNVAYDGGVLEISIGGGAFRDIIGAGGSFVSGGYTATINTKESPLNGRQAWSGLSGGFLATMVNLPDTLAGQSVRFKWRFGFDNGNAYGAGGWYIDSVAVRDGYTCCTAATSADVALSGIVSPNPGRTDQSLAYSLTVTSRGPGPAANTTVIGSLPGNATFVFASPGYTNDGANITWNLGLLAVGRSTNVLLLVSPAGEGVLTNAFTVSSDLPDPNATNNTVAFVTPLLAVPTIVTAPASQTVVAGSDVTLTSSASGTGPLAYQWRFNSVDLPGQTASSLTLTNVDVSHMGNYVVVVTNAAGTASSAPALLRVLVPTQLMASGLALSTTNCLLSFNSLLGLNYTIEYKNSLTEPSWIPVAGTVPGNGGLITLQDTNAPAVVSRFYRVRTE